MITTAGRILALNSDRAVVECHRAAPCVACGGCAQALSWGTRRATPTMLDAFIDDESMRLGVGDEVEIGVADSDLLGASVSVYLPPLLGLTAASALGSWLLGAQNDLLVMSTGLAGLLVGWLASAVLAAARHLTPRPWVLSRTTGRSTHA